MGNQNSGSNSTISFTGSLRSGDQAENQTNYIQMEDHTTGQLMKQQPAQRQNRLKFLSCIQKLNCISNIRNKRLPDWYNHLKHQLTQNKKYSQHKWAMELINDVYSFEQYKNVQEQSIFEVTKASEQSYFDSSEYLARRKDSWRVNKASSQSIRHESNRDNSVTSQMNPQEPINSNELLQFQQQFTIEREKKLESIIENTELLQESLQEHRNSIYQIKSQSIKSRSNSVSSATSAFSNTEEQQYVQDDVKQMSALLTGISAAMDDFQKQMIMEEEEYDKMFKSLNRYKEITRVLQRHMQNTQKNPIAFLLQKYVELFGFTYDSLKLSQPSMYLKIITEEVGDFISFIVDLLRVYYRLDYLLMSQSLSSANNNLSKQNKGSHYDENTYMFFSIDNLQNFICSILFSFESFYRKMNKLFSEVDDEFQQKLKEQIDKKQGISLQELGIKKEFQLNEQTLAQFKKSKESNSTNNNNKYIDQPFFKAIEHIKKTQITKSPLQKLKILLKIYEIIEQDIKEFYEMNGIKQASSCDADNFLGIIQYIIIKAKAYNIYSDIKMIENFVKNSSSKSASSYKLITLQACVYHIQESQI
ncbi:hypothetical protein ABPG72_003234 [Tetrahymena utriculariae]